MFKFFSEKRIDEKSKKDVKATLRKVANGGVKTLLIAAQAAPVVGPFAVLMAELVATCEQVKSNKEAFKNLQGRLQTIAGLFADVIVLAEDDPASTKGASLQKSMDHLEDIIKQAKKNLDSYTNAGFLKNLMGSEPTQTFNDLDSDLTKALNELSFSLQVEHIKAQAMTHNVICNLQHEMEQLGGLQDIAANQAKMQLIADRIGADVSDVKDEITSGIREIQSGIKDLSVGQAQILRELELLRRGPQTKERMLAEIPKIESSHLVWTEQSRVLGTGSYGRVFLGSYQREPVAIKTFKNCTEADLTALSVEVAVHYKISAIPGVIRLYGADMECQKFDKRCIVLELADGSLHDVLYKNAPAIDLSLPRKLDLMLQVATTMASLHKLKVLHRDIKPGNILICVRGGGRVSAKMSDFGLAKEYTDSGFSTMGKEKKGTLLYMAPELEQRKYSDASDVYAFAVTLNEVLAARQPTLSARGLIMFARKEDIQDPASEALLSLILRGLSYEENERPTFEKIVEELSTIHEAAVAHYLLNHPEGFAAPLTIDVSSQKTGSCRFVDLNVTDVCELLSIHNAEHLVTYVQESQLPGKYLVEDLLGKSKQDVIAQMKEAGVEKMHPTHARELLDCISAWHNDGLPENFTPKSSSFKSVSSSGSNGSAYKA